MRDFAYPEAWSAAWCSLPLADEDSSSPYRFEVMCSDLPEARRGRSEWPPAARDPDVWLRWAPHDEPEPRVGFWLRPRRRDPILRDRLVLLEPSVWAGDAGCGTVTRQGVLDACRFAALSGRVVWHNPPKGGARAPHSGHFQAMPLRRPGDEGRRFTFPCCAYEPDRVSWKQAPGRQVHVVERGLTPGRYPVLGLTVSGPVDVVAAHVWSVIWDYDRAAACNLVVEPAEYAPAVRVFVFPPRREPPQFAVADGLLMPDEQLLRRNSPGGAACDWSFAGVEMGLVTQVEWGPLFEEMRAHPRRWGTVLLRLLRALTLDEREADWSEFVAICRRRG